MRFVTASRPAARGLPITVSTIAWSERSRRSRNPGVFVVEASEPWS